MDPNARYATAAQKAIAAPTWQGAGGFTYTLFDDGQVQVRDANGQVTYAQPGTEAHKAIFKESEAKYRERVGPSFEDRLRAEAAKYEEATTRHPTSDATPEGDAKARDKAKRVDHTLRDLETP